MCFVRDDSVRVGVTAQGGLTHVSDDAFRDELSVKMDHVEVGEDSHDVNSWRGVT